MQAKIVCVVVLAVSVATVAALSDVETLEAPGTGFLKADEKIVIGESMGWSGGSIAMGGSFLSTSGSFSMGGGRRLLTTSSQRMSKGKRNNNRGYEEPDEDDIAAANATTGAIQGVIETLLEMGSMIEDHNNNQVKTMVMKKDTQKCVDSLQTIKMAMGDDVPDGFVESLNQQMASICDDLPAESKPPCCPVRNQTVIDEVTQMMHINTDAEILAALQARLDELYAATPTCDANLCWLESETKEVGSSNSQISIQVAGETNYFKGKVQASVTKAGLCIKTRNAAAPLACTRHKICDNLEMDVTKVCTASDLNDCGWKAPSNGPTTSENKEDITTDVWEEAFSDKAGVLTSMVCTSA